ncbi:hypothetical protein D3C78_1436380 [compost metagenome]
MVQSGSGISAKTWRRRSPQVPRIMRKYSLFSSMLAKCVTRRALVSYTSKSSGRPTEMFDRKVESMEISAHLAASSSEVSGRSTRSRMGLPYLASPIWKYGHSWPASMKLPAA